MATNNDDGPTICEALVLWWNATSVSVKCRFCPKAHTHDIDSSARLQQIETSLCDNASKRGQYHLLYPDDKRRLTKDLGWEKGVSDIGKLYLYTRDALGPIDRGYHDEGQFIYTAPVIDDGLITPVPNDSNVDGLAKQLDSLSLERTPTGLVSATRKLTAALRECARALQSNTDSRTAQFEIQPLLGQTEGPAFAKLFRGPGYTDLMAISTPSSIFKNTHFINAEEWTAKAQKISRMLGAKEVYTLACHVERQMITFLLLTHTWTSLDDMPAQEDLRKVMPVMPKAIMTVNKTRPCWYCREFLDKVRNRFGDRLNLEIRGTDKSEVAILDCDSEKRSVCRIVAVHYTADYKQSPATSRT